MDDQLSSIDKWCLFGFGMAFIILPLIGNLLQLHKAIQVWISDPYSKHCVQSWMQFNLRKLYMFAILCGSSFAAVNICNSNLFHLSLFNMGLNKRQQAIFENARILTVVLGENVAQLILQIVYLVLIGESNSISAITIVAMILSVLSIVSSIFNYISSSSLIECEAITVIVMDIQSQQLANTHSKKFRRLIVHRRNPICRELSKIIQVDEGLIEILMPVQTNTGAKLTFYIRNNDSSDKNVAPNIVNTITTGINKGSLATVKCFFIYCVRCEF